MDWRRQAYLQHQQQRWLRPDAALYPALDRKYNADQPRVPAGNGRLSGRWGDGGSGRPRVHIYRSNPDDEVGDGGDEAVSALMGSFDLGNLLSDLDWSDLFDITPREGPSGGVQLAGDPPHQLPEIVVTPAEDIVSAGPGIGHNGGPPLEDPPEVPRVRPSRSRERTATQRTIGSWIGRALNAAISFVGSAIARRVLTLLKVFSVAINAISWLRPYRAQIETYRDPPKTLEDLRRAVNSPRSGTEIHHIIEQKALEKIGYSQREIDTPENRVRVPTLKHYAITRFFQTPNKDYGGLTPRDYLADKSIAERRQVGLDALRQVGVLK